MSSRSSLNHVFRSVWNQALGAMVAVAEIDTSSGGSGAKRIKSAATALPAAACPSALTLAIALAWSTVPLISYANPTGGVAIVGQATMANTGNKLLVTTQNGAGANYSAINWQSFSIPAGSSTYFAQPTANSTSINRVVTNTPTQIFGTLSSNGNLVLVNQAGIAVGAGAVVDTNGFTASSLAMSDADAMAGRLRFGDGAISTAAVSVDGGILARNGDVVLLGSNVNTGVNALVQAPNGSTILAAGQQVEITGRGLEGIRMQVQAPSDTAVNLGTLKGDAVAMFAGTLRHSGAIQSTAIRTEGGKVMLIAASENRVDAGVSAKSLNGVGGDIIATGNAVLLGSHAILDASGDNGGGNVFVGGGWQGGDSRINNSKTTLVATGALINASANVRGGGGTVAVWSDGATHFGGALKVSGGAQSGNGGRAEVSGKQFLSFQGSVDASASNGNSGSLLLDPATLTIQATSPSVDGLGVGDVTGDILSTDYLPYGSVITAGQVGSLLSSGSLSLAATGLVTVASPISATGSNTLTLTSTGGNIALSAGVSASNATVVLSAGYGSVNQSAGAAIVANSLSVTHGYGAFLTDPGNHVNSLDMTYTGLAGVSQPVSYWNNGALSLGAISAGSLTLNTQGGALTQTGAMTIGAGGYLSLDTGTGAITLTNTGNSLVSLSSVVGGSVSISNNSANVLTVGPITASGSVLVETVYGGLTVSGAISANSSGTAIELRSAGTFNAGSSTKSITGGGRWIVHTSDPTSTSDVYGPYTLSSPSSDFIQYGAAFGDTPAQASGNAHMYTYSETLYPIMSGSVVKTYDGTANASLSAVTLDCSQCSPVATDNFSAIAFSGGSGFFGTNSDGAVYDSSVGTNKPVFIDPYLGTKVTVSGVTRGGLPVYGYSVSASNNTIGTINPALVVVSLSGSRVYDGSVNVASGLYTLPAGVSLSGAGTSASKNVGTWGVSGFSLGGTSASNYTLGSVNVTITPLAITGVSGIVAGPTREYDGTTKAPIDTSGAKLVGVVANDNVLLDVGKIAANFKDPFWGSKKPIDVTGLAITGTDIANYTFDASLSTQSIVGDIKQRAVSTWKGGPSGDWSVSTNWDALPVGDNVLSVNLGNANVSYSGLTTKLNSMTAGGLTMGGGSLTVGSGLNLAQFAQSGGSLDVASLTATSSFNQAAGTLTASGAVTGTQGTGNLNVSGITAASVDLKATTGAITQSGPIVTPTLTTVSATGTNLTASGNKISEFNASNTGAGNISLSNTGILKVSGMNNANGDIVLDNIGGVTTVNIVGNGSVSFTANSPLTIGDGGITATGNVALTATNLTSSGNLTINGDVVSTGGSIALAAASDFVQNSTVNAAGGVTATAGGTMTFGPSAKTVGSPLAYSDAKGPLPAPGQTPQGSAPIDFVSTFMSKFEDALLAQNSATGDPTDPKKKDAEGVVVEGQSCTR